MHASEVAALLGWSTERVESAIVDGIQLPRTKARVHLRAAQHGENYDIAEKQLDEFIEQFEEEEPGRHPPMSVRRQLLVEASHRCAICGDSALLKFHHMIPWQALKHHDPAQMLAVCGTCHDKCDNGIIDYRSQCAYKTKLQPDQRSAFWHPRSVAKRVSNFLRPPLPPDTPVTPQIPSSFGHEAYFALPDRERTLKGILDALRNPTWRHVVLIDGLGGVGKTALALEVARRCLREGVFLGAVGDSAKLHVLSDGYLKRVREARLTLAELKSSIGDHLGAPVSDIERILQNAPHLIIVDNLETGDDVRQILDGMRPWLGVSRAIITSRHRSVADCFSVHLAALSDEDSVVFLRTEASSTNCVELQNCSEQVLQQIHRITGGSPLAMKLCVGQAQFFPIRDVLNKLQRAQGDLYRFIFLDDWRLLNAFEQKLLITIGAAIQPMSLRQLRASQIVESRHIDEALSKLIRLSLIHTSGKGAVHTLRYYSHQLTKHFLLNDLPAVWKAEGLL